MAEQSLQQFSQTGTLSQLVAYQTLNERVYSPHSIELGHVYDTIAKWLVDMDQYAKSLSYLEQSVDIVKACFGKSSIEALSESVKLCQVLFMRFVFQQFHIETSHRHGERKEFISNTLNGLRVFGSLFDADINELESIISSLP